MRIICACDPYGSALHTKLVQHLGSKPGVEVDNRGRFSKYYVAAHGVAGEVEAAAAAGRSDLRALLICGSGQGMSIIANKWPHVYAALCTTPEAAAGGRSVNGANVLCLGGQVTAADDACRILDAWLYTELGEGWAPEIQEFISCSMQEIPALAFTPAAAAAATAAPLRGAVQQPAAGQ
ncbi:hypothetical protein CHLNCDRAFT_142651 [Chlorella variabilis]|uniref:Ribose-5-phosphate isomerase n=1 Tax=Chlorella variabilis TaxID=554065 RepID=E1ZU11_CHLVA|nr:hypothetical protein CHLNCDRAFT_142651 [Chlorella variabilis]EFN50685.1 hypothetical protein CHLNCDRAFT_142651 [Chlorella variabilis]|eukprot:XP_005842797.1 hypothetical protein CHLNCDRAFT_142651 [Chlorella variabilis]